MTSAAHSGLLWSLVAFATVVVVTPGANNLLAARSGLQAGVRASGKLLAGLGLGVISVVVLAAMGLGVVVTSMPAVRTALRVAGTGYLLWLAIQIARSGRPEIDHSPRAAPGFRTGLLISWLNPKVWMLGVSAVAGYSTLAAGPAALAMLLGGVFTAAVIPNLLLWCGFGHLIARKLTTGRQWQIVNVGLAALLAATIVLIWLE